MKRSASVSPLCPTHFPAFLRKIGLLLHVEDQFPHLSFLPTSSFLPGLLFFPVPYRYCCFPEYYPFSLFPPSPLFPSYLSPFFLILTLNTVDPWAMQVWTLNYMGLLIHFFSIVNSTLLYNQQLVISSDMEESQCGWLTISYIVIFLLPGGFIPNPLIIQESTVLLCGVIHNHGFCHL